MQALILVYLRTYPSGEREGAGGFGVLQIQNLVDKVNFFFFFEMEKNRYKLLSWYNTSLPPSCVAGMSDGFGFLILFADTSKKFPFITKETGSKGI